MFVPWQVQCSASSKCLCCVTFAVEQVSRHFQQTADLSGPVAHGEIRHLIKPNNHL